MKIGVNFKKIKEIVMSVVNTHYNVIVLPSMQYLDRRVTTLENNSEWVEITSSNGQEAEITQPFTEIRMLAKVGSNGNIYCITIPYDSNIFHNSQTAGNKYFITGNPTQNNYGCKFKYMVNSNGKQYVCVDSCFDGGSYDACEFRAWIR